jgi:hypothetical protein
MIAQKYGQDPRAVALWQPEWLAAASTLIEAEAGAASEIQAREQRKARMGSKRRGA